MEEPKRTTEQQVDLFVDHLIVAHDHAQKMLDLLYGPDKVKRSLWYRLRLSRAQSILIHYMVKELERESHEIPPPTRPPRKTERKE